LDYLDPYKRMGEMDRGSVRWAVNKARKMGVTVRESKNNEDFNAFYQLNCPDKKELGVPCHRNVS
jgi:hypothetical protein